MINLPKLCGNCEFSQNFHTKNSGEIMAFYEVHRAFPNN